MEELTSLSFDIPFVNATYVLPEVELYPMPQPQTGDRDTDCDDAGSPRTDTRTAMTRNGDIYSAAVCCGLGARYLWKSTDGGKSWEWREITSPSGRHQCGFGILADDTFLIAYTNDDISGLWIARSTDYGKSWSKEVTIDISPYNHVDGGWAQIYQHPDGTVMLTMQLRPPGELHEYIYHSRDMGKTWDERTLLCKYGCETSLLSLRNSKKMLAFIRYMRDALPGENIQSLGMQTGWSDKRLAGKGQRNPFKNAVIAESFDRGRTWQNFRVFDTFGSVPGELVQGHDGRIAAVWLQRYPHAGAHIRVRVSADEGETWSDIAYQMFQGTGYPSSIVRDDGTIVTVCEKSDLDERGTARRRTLVAAHWKMPR